MVDTSASMTLEDPYTGANSVQMREYLEKVTAELHAAASAPTAGWPGRGDQPLRTGDGHLEGCRLGLRKLTETQQVLFFTGSGRAEPVGFASNAAEVDAARRGHHAGQAAGEHHGCADGGAGYSGRAGKAGGSRRLCS